MRENVSADLVYLSLDQGERANQDQVQQLLPQALYVQVRQRIKAVVPQRKPGRDGHRDASDAQYVDFHSMRCHNAVLIEGSRGTGKSTVLVNLPLYLEKAAPELADQVHVLKPVDPTQLEDDDDLFLNVIVAAVMSDATLQRAQQYSEAGRQQLYHCLEDLGHKLEGRQTQKNDVGLDRLRAFMGSHELALAVHRFFEAALFLLGKNLLVLPIDDVDTTLHRAFENLEVVRRYLATPYVLPVICGELALYDEVIWRDFYSRLTRDGKDADAPGAEAKARELAVEYERKLLQVHNRLQMPPVQHYLGRTNILLTSTELKKNGGEFNLAGFYNWLRALLGGTVNGLENSGLSVPIPTVRALTQLLNGVKELVEKLPPQVRATDVAGDRLAMCRLLWMPDVKAMAMAAFAKAQREARSAEKLDSRKSYLDFQTMSSTAPATPGAAQAAAQARDWYGPLLEHFRYEPKAGAACLVLLAYKHWQVYRASEEVAGRVSVLATPLFQPTLQQPRDHGYLTYLECAADISSWEADLKNRLPESLIKRLPKKSILPFAAPEVGRAVSGKIKYRLEPVLDNMNGHHQRFNLIAELLLHRNYYSDSKRAPLICIGRILELVVTSLVKPLTYEDVQSLLWQAPFHSTAAVAPTKTLYFGAAEEDEDNLFDEEESYSQNERHNAIMSLVDAVAIWRADHSLENVEISPWLIYNALNKVFNQAWMFNRPSSAVLGGRQLSAREVALLMETGRTAFNAFWAAIGSFEKGALFGLPDVIATVNINPGKDFKKSTLYLQNIAPFAGQDSSSYSFGRATRALTYFLGNHPLNIWLNDAPEPAFFFPKAEQQASTVNVVANSDPKRAARYWLYKEATGKDYVGTGNLTYRMVFDVVRERNWSSNELADLQNRLKTEHARAKEVHEKLAEAIEQIQSSRSQ